MMITASDDDGGGGDLILMVGPHKTGSTLLQRFLRDMSARKLLGNYRWPASGNSDKVFAKTALALVAVPSPPLSSDPSREQRADTSSAVLQTTQREIRKIFDQNRSSVMASEVFDYLATLEESAWEATIVPRLWKDLIPSNQVKKVEVVISYRTPRLEQLESVWHQLLVMAAKGHSKDLWLLPNRSPKQSKVGGMNSTLSSIEGGSTAVPTMAEWLCHGHWNNEAYFDIETILLAQVNPMGLAYAFHQFGKINVTLIDLGPSLDPQGLFDAVACQILSSSTNCLANGTFVLPPDYNRRKMSRADQRPAEKGFSEQQQLEQLEQLLRRMDCYHFCKFSQDEVKVVGKNDSMFDTDNQNLIGWNGCCLNPEQWLEPRAAVQAIRDLSCNAMKSPQATDGEHELNDVHNLDVVSHAFHWSTVREQEQGASPRTILFSTSLQPPLTTRLRSDVAFPIPISILSWFAIILLLLTPLYGKRGRKQHFVA